MVIAIMQTTSDRLRLGYDRLQTNFGQTSRRQTPTLDFGSRPDFEHQTSDFEFHTTNLRLRTDFELQTSEFEFQTLNLRYDTKQNFR